MPKPLKMAMKPIKVKKLAAPVKNPAAGLPFAPKGKGKKMPFAPKGK